MSFPIFPWPRAILHLDGDAFFASVLQVVNPKLLGKPVVVGAERGIATAVSYEAKKMGVKRGLPIFEIKKHFPQCVILESDYEIYSLFSQKMFSIMRSLLIEVEEYSIDEGFSDITGLQRPLSSSYQEIGKEVQQKIRMELGLNVSVGISLTKSLAKLASNFYKPEGLTVINGLEIKQFLPKIPLLSVWGIGPQTNAFLKKFNVKTAYDLATLPKDFLANKLTKSCWEIVQELQGKTVYAVNPCQKDHYQSISQTQTFSPASNDSDLLWGKISQHIEQCFLKARKFRYQVGKVGLFLKTNHFRYFHSELKLLEPTNYPLLIRKELRDTFLKIYNPQFLYRATGCFVSDLSSQNTNQIGLFDNQKLELKAEKIYTAIDFQKINFGSRLLDKTGFKNRTSKPKMAIPTLDLNI